MNETQNSIGSWLTAIYKTNLSLESQVLKLQEEFDEFNQAIEKEDLENAAEELADMVIVIFGCAFVMGFSILKMINKKMKTNRQRTWAIMNGVLHHVE